MALVSIIVPVYNVAMYIERCWESIKQQTYKNIEVLFIDDCGLDESVSILEKLIAGHKDFYCKIIHHEQNRGLSAARNTGISNATGDYVYFLDSDDELTEDCIEKLVKPIAQNGKRYDVVSGDYRSVGGFVDCVLRTFGEIKEIDRTFFKNLWYCMAQNKIYKKSFIINNNILFLDGIIHEDELFSFKIACLAKSMFIINDVTYNYYINPNSTMTSLKKERHYFSWAIIVREMARFAKDKKREEDYELFNYVEKLKTNYSEQAYRYLDRQSFNTFYMILSEYKWKPFRYFIKGLLYWKRFLRDLCFILPKQVGFKYLCLWYKFTLKDL